MSTTRPPCQTSNPPAATLPEPEKISSSLHQGFSTLTALLTRHADFWRQKPFTCRRLDWEQQHAALGNWLRARSLQQAEAVHNDPAALAACGAPAPFGKLAEECRALSSLPELPRPLVSAMQAKLSTDVPGRKWQQINSLAACLDFSRPTQHWLDWCSGKGHLGRRLAFDGTPLTCLEYDPALVESGQRLSQRFAIEARHVCQDVMMAEAASQLAAHHTPVALHACGELHVRLLELASQQGCRQLAVAPCCYNRISSEYYQPLSQAGRAAGLVLSRDDLRLPLAETVTGGARVRRQRDASMARRLAFDLWQRELRGVDDYLPVPPLPLPMLQLPVRDWCLQVAARKGLDVPSEPDWTALEAAGWQRLAEVRNLELVRGLFRRPMEVWLLLDRALYLQEQGWQVRIGSFCDYQLTPRNLLLLAERD